jgi:acyl transferase domain-containing protein
MDPILDELEREGAKVTFKAPSLPLLTNLEGTLSGPGKLFGPAYLRRHAREPVLFQAAFEAALAAGASTLIEVGPSATLIGLGKQIAGERAVECAVPSLRRAQHGLRTLLEAAAKLYQHGHDLDWGVFHAETKCRRVPLPTYPFQRARYWFVPRASAGSAHALAPVMSFLSSASV